MKTELSNDLIQSLVNFLESLPLAAPYSIPRHQLVQQIQKQAQEASIEQQDLKDAE